jgi:hypothetical protein
MEQLQVQCYCVRNATLAWVGRHHVEEASALFLMNVIDPLVQPLQDLQVNLCVDHPTLYHVLLVNDVSLVTEHCEHAFSSRRLSFEFFSF